MKFIAIAFLLFTSLSAHATGMKRQIHACQGGTGEYAAGFQVYHVSMSPPGGPVTSYYIASASSSWLGGTHASGDIRVNPLRVESGTVEYSNAEAGFSLKVLKLRNTRRAGKSALVEASFRDPATGMRGSIPRRWITCQN